MAQQLLDLINRFGGAQAVSAIAARVGISPQQAQAAMAALMPAVAGGLAKADPATLDAAAAPAADIAPASDAGVREGEGLASQIFGAGGTTAVTAQAARATGLDAGILAQLLPMVTTLAAGTLAGKASGPQGAAGTLAGLLDRHGDGSPMNDIMGMAGKLFGR